MATPDDKDGDGKARATDGYIGSRAISNRGVIGKRQQERNVATGNLVELVPERQYKAIGLDISSTDFSKVGVGGDFRRIRNAYFNTPGSEVVVRGITSPSVRTGSTDADLANRRAESAKASLVKEGIPPESIRVEQTPKSNLDPRATSPEQKASMRGASIEILPPQKISRPENRFTDQVILVKRKPGWEIRIPEIPHLPELPDLRPWLKKHIQDVEARTRRKVENNDHLKKLAAAGLLITVLPELVGAVGIEAVLHFLPFLIEAAAEEYGREKVKKYIKEKLKKRLQDRANERNRTEEDRFMKEMLQKIIDGGLDVKGKHHPLYFLVNPATMDWISRKVGDKIAVQPGHTLSHKAYGFALALEDAYNNQRFRGDKIETPGGFAFSMAYKIAGVYVDRGSAQFWEREGFLPAGTIAIPSVGWIDF